MKDLALLVTSQVCILGGAWLSVVLFLNHLAPIMFGPLDGSPSSLAAALVFILCLLVFLLLGGVLGLFAWPVMVRPFISRKQFLGFIGAGPQMRIPGISPVFYWISKSLYREKPKRPK